MNKINKGEKGYLNYRKIALLLSVLGCLAGVALFFFTGYIRYNSTKTIFTVLAVLMVLPAAKQFVIYAVMAPYKSVDFDKYDTIDKIISDTNVHMISDLVITSPERVVNVDLICVKGGRIIGYASHKKADTSYVSEHLKKVINPQYKVNQMKVVNEFDKYINYIDELKLVEESKYDEDITKLILSQCV